MTPAYYALLGASLHRFLTCFTPILAKIIQFDKVVVFVLDGSFIFLLSGNQTLFCGVLLSVHVKKARSGVPSVPKNGLVPVGKKDRTGINRRRHGPL